MKLQKLLKGIKTKTNSQTIMFKDINGIAIDHRKVKEGDLFVAMKGESFNANRFVDEALRKGAKAIISEEELGLPESIRVPDIRKAYAIASKHFYNDACDKVKIVAVTGTNGKTTVCNTVADILRTNGRKVGVIGTLGAKVEDEIVETGMTTPDPDKLHKIFKQMYECGVEYVVMEASAHAIALEKLEGIKFEVGVLTNITEDHLDFFGDMQSYAQAKLRLFDKNRVKKAVVCEENLFDERLLKNISMPYVSYGIKNKNADLTAKVIKKDFSGSSFICKFKSKENLFATRLVGLYNIENLLASIAVCKALGLPMEEIKKGACCTLQVEGRFNVIKINGQNIIIDFAHTPDGLEKVLSTTRELSKGKIVVIFGCGGNRDRLKRPIMGEIASFLADEVIITSDNPRFERPMDIIADIEKGIAKDNAIAIEDRKEAIEYALDKYPSGTTIVIAGKGGEKYQDIGGIKIPYNDFDVVSDYFKKRLSGKCVAPKTENVEDVNFEEKEIE